MERAQRQNTEPANPQRPAQAKFTSKSRENELANSPMMTAQRRKLQGLFSSAAQLKGPEEEQLQGKFDTVQRAEEEEKPLQGKFATVQRAEEEEPVQGKFASTTPAQREETAPAKPNHTGLPDNLKSGIESLSGMSMDNVKVHYNSSQPAQLNALAYAQGTDIHVAPGQEQHLPHEAWHVVQQAQGRVKPTMQMKEGVPVNDDKSLEHEADVMGGKAMQMVAKPNMRPSASHGQAAGAIQFVLYSSAHVNMKAGWDPDQHPWPGTHGNASGFWAGTNAVKGSDVNSAASKLCRDVETVTNDLSSFRQMGSPHMAPKRMGGKGDVNNVRPWTQDFESNNWHGTLDNQVKTEFKTLKAGTTFYEDVDTDESHSRTEAWLKPLQDKFDASADGEDKKKLGDYLIHLRNILRWVPDGAKIITPGGSYAATGNTFDPAPINIKKAKKALKNFNGGKWENLTTVVVDSKISRFFKTLGITLAVGAIVGAGYLLAYGYPF